MFSLRSTAKISLTSAKPETISAEGQKGVLTPWAVWMDAEMGVPLPGPGLAVPGQPGASHLHLHLLCWMWPQQIKENTRNKFQQFLDLSSGLSAHQAAPAQGNHFLLYSYQRNQFCCCLHLQSHSDIILTNQLWNQSCVKDYAIKTTSSVANQERINGAVSK